MREGGDPHPAVTDSNFLWSRRSRRRRFSSLPLSLPEEEPAPGEGGAGGEMHAVGGDGVLPGRLLS